MIDTSEESPPGRTLSRAQIVAASIVVIDRDGPEALTMRSLAREFGVVPMALYRYVHGREDLLEAVVDELLRGLQNNLDGELATSSWQGYLQSLAHAMRTVAVQHARAFPLIATRHPAAPWLRPPLRSLDLVEHFLETLQRHGFTDDQTVATYRAFSSFLLGNLLLEASVRGAKTSAVELPLDEGDAQVPHRHGEVDLSQLPQTVRLRPILSEDHSEDEFEVGLETLLDRLEMGLSQ